MKELNWEAIQSYLLATLGGQSNQLTWQIDHSWDIYRLFKEVEPISNQPKTINRLLSKLKIEQSSKKENSLFNQSVDKFKRMTHG